MEVKCFGDSSGYPWADAFRAQILSNSPRVNVSGYTVGSEPFLFLGLTVLARRLPFLLWFVVMISRNLPHYPFFPPRIVKAFVPEISGEKVVVDEFGRSVWVLGFAEGFYW